MSRLSIHPQDASTPPRVLTEFDDIADVLGGVGVRFERWAADAPLSRGAGQEETLAAYRNDVERLMTESGYRSADVISLTPDHPQRDALRAKFLDEHTHGEDEIRFFVEGRGLFYLHIDGRVYGVLCEKDDLISVPAGTPHWFDMGPRPHFIAIRLFGNPDGWVARFTGDPIAERFPRLEG
ncbi:1,2-dihydroxy-3-keto-5-methylthiopentene dioxygenase [Acidihalobacter prosperus]|uniref:Acireductone dioxygenase n=1 Tax=Acidihalobacter prosperus TaxID=160660 RepID=A0A1A6C6P3_9GAMM|nr:acireductone dioxygenase [Acidihalobacter prosperus]OBS10231.1 hypothetical protein Thpro_021281 [Acidihalobacter prosperus]